MAVAPYQESDWADRWSAQAMARGLDIEFVLPEARPLWRAVFWYSGSLPALAIEGRSAEESTRETLAQIPAARAGLDVREVTVPLHGNCCRLRLRFAASTAELALGDIELWARQ